MESDSVPKGKMRTGYTTGTSATAGAKAGVLAILNQEKIGLIDVTLPKKSKIQIKIEKCEFDRQSAHCYVIKDGGDDPDVTHGAEINTE
ncbi:MAG: cobalt-precorrin-5B (C(1))-methyltransferase, partial [Nitrosotalea sp.]